MRQRGYQRRTDAGRSAAAGDRARAPCRGRGRRARAGQWRPRRTVVAARDQRDALVADHPQRMPGADAGQADHCAPEDHVGVGYERGAAKVA
eukprot:SAG22_NODE_178_length_16142_cov_13.187995_4_plen_92_part_00